MKHLMFLFIVISNILFAQNNHDSIQEVEIVPLVNKVHLKLGVGALIPQDRLNNFIKTSPVIDLAVEVELSNRKFFEFGFNLSAPNQNEEFTYHRLNDTVRTKATFMSNLYAKYKIPLTKSNQLKLNFGLGLSNIQTNARKQNLNDDDRGKYESIYTFLFSTGFEYRFTIADNHNLIISFTGQYTPYKVEGAVQEDIGSFTLIPKLSYEIF